MSMGRRQSNWADEADAFSYWGRKFYSYLQRAGVTSSIKRKARRRERRQGKADIRKDRDA